MSEVGIILLSVGVLGFFWTLYGSMLISLIFGSLKNTLSAKKNSFDSNYPMSFEILVAAYNEERTIAASLKSFEAAMIALKTNQSLMNVSVFVGLDHCTDKTLEIVQSFKAVKYFENSGPRGKWFIVKQLIEKSQADWVSLTDCGSVWTPELLVEIEFLLKDNDLICIAPSYLPANAKFLETMYWRMEQFIRTVENLGGGSIMVHGPSVFYKRSALLRAIELLGSTHWFNDDVAIPLVLRLDKAKNKIHYFASFDQVAWVRDIGVVSDVNIERRRRKRILIGNLQVIKNLVLPKFKFFSLASWTGFRLVAKVLWAYWATFFALGFVLILASSKMVSEFLAHPTPMKVGVEIAVFLFIVFAVKTSNYIQRLFMAYLSGLGIFKGWKILDTPEKISWS
jgi:cellulose synthase/poly-beta-1,6-N-acetylglucosamine synthase-like glycosyltransferase